MPIVVAGAVWALLVDAGRRGSVGPVLRIVAGNRPRGRLVVVVIVVVRLRVLPPPPPLLLLFLLLLPLGILSVVVGVEFVTLRADQLQELQDYLHRRRGVVVAGSLVTVVGQNHGLFKAVVDVFASLVEHPVLAIFDRVLHTSITLFILALPFERHDVLVRLLKLNLCVRLKAVKSALARDLWRRKFFHAWRYAPSASYKRDVYVLEETAN